jgi:predicted MFS family arabinose efflux permease
MRRSPHRQCPGALAAKEKSVPELVAHRLVSDAKNAAETVDAPGNPAAREERLSPGTEAMQPRSGIFYGWRVVMASALGLFLGPIPVAVFSFGVFLQPFAQEFHSSRGAVSLARTLNSAILALCLPFVGRLIDRFGASRIIVPSLVISGVTLLSARFCSGKIWQLYLLYVAIGVAFCGGGPVAYSVVISRWFDRSRGLALGLMMSGLGAGALLTPPAAQWSIAKFGWRLTLEAAGAAVLAIALPFTAMVLKDRPESMGLEPDGRSSPARDSSTAATEPGLPWRDALRTPLFWLLLCAFALVSAAVTACFAHITPILSDRGMPARTAALATSLFGGGLLAGRCGLGYLLDRFFAPRVAAAVFGFAACGVGILRLSSSPGLAFVAAFVIGMGLGAEVDIMAFLAGRYFGLRSFAAIYGILFAIFGLSGGVGTYLLGAAYDALGSYSPMLSVLCAATAAGALLMLSPGPYRYPNRLR